MEPTRRCPYCAEEILAAAIKCKHCQSVLGMPETSKPRVSLHSESPSTRSEDRAPPEPPVMIRRPFKIMLWIIIGVIGAAFVFSRIYPGEQAEAEIKAPPGVAVADIETPKDKMHSIYTTTAVDLYRSYQANEVATDQKIGTSIVQITGTIKAIDKDMFGDPEIRLNVGDDFNSVALTLDKSQLSAAGALSKGQSVIARCDKVTRIIDYPVGEHCHLSQSLEF